MQMSFSAAAKGELQMGESSLLDTQDVKSE